jgi:hypothetical protein
MNAAQQQPQKDFGDLLAQWDSARWSIACREMQVRILRGSIEAAHRVLARFIVEANPGLATLDNHVSTVFGARIAGILESERFESLRAVDQATDEQLLSIPGMGARNLEAIRETVEKVKRSECLAIPPDEEYERLIDAEHGYFARQFYAPAAAKRDASKSKEKPV